MHKEEPPMFSAISNRRTFAARLAALLPGLGFASLAAAEPAPPARDKHKIIKLDSDGKPAGPGFITPVIVRDGLVYIAGQGAHSRGDNSDTGKTPDIEMHGKMVMENVKACVEAGGGTMESILQLTVFLTNLNDYDGFNKVFKTYFPNSGPARTCVAVAGLPGQSLVEVNCVAAVVRSAKKGA
jgi:2-iminobutanoate/2-iminopropanoate deaminase